MPSRTLIAGACCAAAVLSTEPAWALALPKVLVNHLGYDARGPKKLIVQFDEDVAVDAFQIVDEQGSHVFEGRLQRSGTVDNWRRGSFAHGSFTGLTRPGVYRVRVSGPAGEAWSEAFSVRPKLLAEACLPDVLFYLKSQRSSGVYDQTDRSVPFFGQSRPRVDVHGGWYDASGDVSKYLSHLSYANYMNPQQTPLVVWALLEAGALLKDDASPRLASLPAMLQEEALHGADFLVRMQDAEGYFYINVFDKWSHDPQQREICAYETQEGHKKTAYQAAFREGGGMAIAALARASTLGLSGEHPAARYLEVAEKGFAHLQANNLRYVDDGQENIIDDYCALLAAVELYQATRKGEYLAAARLRQQALVKRLHRDAKFDGFWRADAAGQRPFFHAAEAGLPVVALLRYRAVEPDAGRSADVLKAVAASLAFELKVTGEVANPFGYARQYVKDLGGATRSAFFFPHRNESGYWWQGENARLGSLAAAAFLASRQLPAAERGALHAYASDQLDWILGLNPFDMCMLQGKGRNNPDYLPENPNAPGGVCNGITSGFDDERGIAFLPKPHDADPAQNWRWSEQWIPHGAWLVLALAAQQAALAP